ncbi:MAG: tetratricopeptide repeat protein [Gemmataceae bacterium]|nr:tetratricopeptide repeat protein [Gemmataceae bacterium]
MFGRFRRGVRAGYGLLPRPLVWLVGVVGLARGVYVGLPVLREEYHYQAACLAVDREEFDAAGDHLRACLALVPGDGRPHFLAAQTARRAGQFDLAAEELRISRELGWAAVGVRAEEVMLAFQRGDFDPEAERVLRAWADADDTDPVLALEALGQGYMRTYRLGLALDYLGRWVARRPDSVAARMRRGWVFERLERWEEAEADYQHAATVRPDYRPGRLRLAQVLRVRGDLGRAVAEFERLRTETPDDPQVATGLGQAYTGLGRDEEARGHLLKAAAADPRNSLVPLELGGLAMRAGRPEEAADYFQKAIDAAPEDYQPHYQMYLCQQRLGRPDRVVVEETKFKAIAADLKLINELTQELQARPNDPDLRYRIAEIFFRRGEEAEGAVWLESVVQVRPDHAAARRKLVEYYDRTGRSAKAAAHRWVADATPAR